MEYVTKGLQPEDALQYFEEISAIPRGSGNEGAVARYICEVAEKAGLQATRDEANNVIVKKPASAGCENAAPVMLQAVSYTHLLRSPALCIPHNNGDITGAGIFPAAAAGRPADHLQEARRDPGPPPARAARRSCCKRSCAGGPCRR